MKNSTKNDLKTFFAQCLLFIVVATLGIGLAALLSSCWGKADRIDHTDKNYIYVWQYNKNDSTLKKFKQPEYKEFKVMGGHHKHHHIEVDFNNNGRYECFSIRTSNRCDEVRRAQYARFNHKPLTGIFKINYYPHYYIEFVRYKD